MRKCNECNISLGRKIDFCPNCGNFNKKKEKKEIAIIDSNKIQIFSILAVFISAICVLVGLICFLFFSKYISAIFAVGIVLTNIIMFTGAILLFDKSLFKL